MSETSPGYPVLTPEQQRYQPMPSQHGYVPYQPPPRQPVLAEGAEYHMALTGPGNAWWRPLVAVPAVLVGFGVLTIGFGVVMMLGLMIIKGDVDGVLNGDVTEILRMDDPWIFGTQNLMLASLIPLAGLTTWLIYQVRPGFVSSVVGRFRWGWAAWCAALLVPVWGAYIVAASALMPTTAAGGGAGGEGQRPEHWVLLLVLMLLTTPLQSAGEEYLFRGWIMQQMGAVFRHRWVALVAAILLSSSLFALAHGSLDPWIFLDLMGMATGMVILTWRTGGLEAAVVLHAVNNLFAIGYAILFGNLADSFIDTDTSSDAVSTLISWGAVAVATVALLALARWRGVERTVRPRVPTSVTYPA